jgi:Tol biopolymer transport system component
VVDFEADTTRVLLEDVSRAWYVSTGEVVWVRSDGAVFGTPFDPDRLILSERHEPLFDGVGRNDAYRVYMAFGEDGTVLYTEGRSEGLATNQLYWFDRRGWREPVDPDWEGTYFTGPAFSPDGRFLAAGVSSGELGSTSQIWVKELPDGPRARMTTGDGWHPLADWHPSRPQIAFLTSEAGNYDLCMTRTDGTSPGSCEMLLDLEGSVRDLEYTVDGEGIVFRSGGDLGYLDLATGEVRKDLLSTEFTERDLALSPDGRWLAHVSNSSGRFEVYVRPFPDVNSYSRQISTDGGRFPLWAHNGRELFYRGGDRWVTTVNYTADSTFRVESRERLFDPGFSPYQGWNSWAISPDDDRFVIVVPLDVEGRTIQILNFFTELNERMGR